MWDLKRELRSNSVAIRFTFLPVFYYVPDACMHICTLYCIHNVRIRATRAQPSYYDALLRAYSKDGRPALSLVRKL